MLWNYFATRHGKRGVDGASALLKRKLRKEQIEPQGLKIQNAGKVVYFLQFEANKLHATHENVRRTISKTLWEIKVGDVDRMKDNIFVKIVIKQL